MKKKKTTKKGASSPYATAAGLALVIIAVIGIIVWYMIDINNNKEELVKVRQSYADNINQISILEELRAKSEAAQQKLEGFNAILPESLDDAFMIEENLMETAKKFNLKVEVPEDITQLQFSTAETTFYITVTGEYKDIMSFMQYISTLKQIHRIDKFVLSSNDKGERIAELAITVLSQNGASGLNPIAP